MPTAESAISTDCACEIPRIARVVKMAATVTTMLRALFPLGEYVCMAQFCKVLSGWQVYPVCSGGSRRLQTYTDEGMLPMDARITKLPSLKWCCHSSPTNSPTKFSPSKSGAVQRCPRIGNARIRCNWLQQRICGRFGPPCPAMADAVQKR